MRHSEKLHKQDKARERRQEGEYSTTCVSSLRGSESLKQLYARSLCPALRRNEQT